MHETGFNTGQKQNTFCPQIWDRIAETFASLEFNEKSSALYKNSAEIFREILRI